MKPKYEYWSCIIGPTDRNKLVSGAEDSLRMAVRNAFLAITGKKDFVCSSCWGVSEKKYKLLRRISVLSSDQIDVLYHLIIKTDD
jgi:hypothetical protein